MNADEIRFHMRKIDIDVPDSTEVMVEAISRLPEEVAAWALDRFLFLWVAPTFEAGVRAVETVVFGSWYRLKQIRLHPGPPEETREQQIRKVVRKIAEAWILNPHLDLYRENMDQMPQDVPDVDAKLAEWGFPNS
ncbi:hypothetical protein GC163_21110 [bacterium]|nr:hypothetical protein [bacterium]